MTEPTGPARHFGEAQAANYDANFAKLAPLKDALHLCMRGVLHGLAENARILCVGAGTGAEVLYLAEAFPDWQFVIVEPSAPMCVRCRQRVDDAGIAPRCTFHEGYLDSLPPSAPFDAATAILVSQFILETEARRDFFTGIAGRLRSGGILVTADLAGEMSSAEAEAWMALMRYNGVTPEAIANYRTALESSVAVLKPDAIEGLIASSGFDTPTHFCQTALIHAWCARRV